MTLRTTVTSGNLRVSFLYLRQTRQCRSSKMSTPDVPQSPAGSGDQSTKKAARKPHRIISCVKCQQRKIKCDRNSPCANCMKSRLQCVPASALGPRQRRRRIPERELLNRLRHCEKLLRLNNISCEPLSSDIAQFVTPIGDNKQTHDSTSTVSPSATTQETISETRYPYQLQTLNLDH